MAMKPSQCAVEHTTKPTKVNPEEEVVETAVKMVNFMDLDATTAEMDRSEASESRRRIWEV